jgi:hypothetical protein
MEKLRVKEMVNRLKLNEHEPLTEARRKVWMKTSLLIERYQKAKSQYCNGGNPAAKEKVRSCVLQVKEMAKPNAELSSVAKWRVLSVMIYNWFE